MNTGPCCIATVCLPVFALAAASCISVKTEHKVEPIHITMDVNVRMEKALDETFSGLDAKARQIAAQRSVETEDSL